MSPRSTKQCILEIAFYSFFIVVLKPLVLHIGHILAFDVNIVMDTGGGGGGGGTTRCFACLSFHIMYMLHIPPPVYHILAVWT